MKQRQKRPVKITWIIIKNEGINYRLCGNKRKCSEQKEAYHSLPELHLLKIFLSVLYITFPNERARLLLI